MADIAPPRTPTPSSGRRRKLDEPSSLHSPVAMGTMTPPPSDRKVRQSSSSKIAPMPGTPTRQSSRHSRHSSLHNSGGSSSFSASPSVEQIQEMSETELRDLVSDLVPALGEARMELAHVRLQFQLLSMETQEQAQRAEVEHEMTRKELEVLQAGSPIIQNRSLINPDPQSILGHVQGQLDGALQMGRQVEEENRALVRRLKDAKRVIKYLDGQVFDLKETNKMLRQRIVDNREHIDAMRTAGLLRSSPGSPKAGQAVAASNSVNHYATPARPRKQPEVHISQSRNNQLVTPNTARPQDDPFGALLFAGEVLNAQHQRASVPSTPSPGRTLRHPQGHTRGAMSLSSLPVTPRVSQFAPINVAAPSGQTTRGHNPRHRRGSASTISDSQESRDGILASRALAADEESLTDDEVPGSQASRAASDLLKKHAGDGLRQTKITGKVVKNAGKRVHSGDKHFESPKKQKTSGREGLGLGIGMWPSPAR